LSFCNFFLNKHKSFILFSELIEECQWVI